MAEEFRRRPGPGEDSVTATEMTWAQVIRRDLVWGISLAIASLLMFLLWDVLPDRGRAVFVLALVVWAGVEVVRRDKALWYDRPWEFAKKHPLEVVAILLMGAGVYWWMIAEMAGDPPYAPLGLAVAGSLLYELGLAWPGYRKDEPSETPPLTRLERAKRATGVLVFFASYCGFILLGDYFF